MNYLDVIREQHGEAVKESLGLLDKAIGRLQVKLKAEEKERDDLAKMTDKEYAEKYPDKILRFEKTINKKIPV